MRKTIIKLLARFFGHKGYQFDGSRAYYWKVPMIVLPMQTLGQLQHDLQQKFGNDINKMIYKLGKLQGRNGSNILIEKFKVTPDASDLSFFLEQSEFVGVGKTIMVESDIDKGYFLLKNTNSPMAKGYEAVYGKTTKPVCNYWRGLATGAFEAIFTTIKGEPQELESYETHCICKGDPECRVEIRKKSDMNNKLYNEQSEISNKHLDMVMEKETLKMLLRPASANPKKTETDISLAFKRLNKGHLKFEDNGVVLLSGLPSLITPIDIVALLFYTVQHSYGPGADKIISNVGVQLGKTFTDQLMHQLKLNPTNIAHVRMVLQQPGLFGLGTGEPMKMDLTGKNFITKIHNTPAVNYTQLLGSSKIPMDYFIAGILSGSLEILLGQNFTTTEQACFAVSRSPCVFKSSVR